MSEQITIKRLREARNWSRQDAAKHFGVNLTTILRWENNGIPSRGPARRAIENAFAQLQTPRPRRERAA